MPTELARVGRAPDKDVRAYLRYKDFDVLLKEGGAIVLAQNGKELNTLPPQMTYGHGFCEKVELRKSNIFFVNNLDQLVVVDLEMYIPGVQTPPLYREEVVAGGVRDFIFDTDGTAILLRTGGIVEKAHMNQLITLPDDHVTIKIYGTITKRGNHILISRTNQNATSHFHKQEYFLLDSNLTQLDFKSVDVDWACGLVYLSMFERQGQVYAVGLYKKDFADLIAIVNNQIHMVHLRHPTQMGELHGAVWVGGNGTPEELLTYGKKGLNSVRIE